MFATIKTVCICMCVFLCELLFTVHAFLSEAFCEGVGVDLQLRDLKTKKRILQLVHLLFCLCSFLVYIYIYMCVYYFGTLLFW